MIKENWPSFAVSKVFIHPRYLNKKCSSGTRRSCKYFVEISRVFQNDVVTSRDFLNFLELYFKRASDGIWHLTHRNCVQMTTVHVHYRQSVACRCAVFFQHVPWAMQALFHTLYPYVILYFTYASTLCVLLGQFQAIVPCRWAEGQHGSMQKAFTKRLWWIETQHVYRVIGKFEKFSLSSFNFFTFNHLFPSF